MPTEVFDLHIQQSLEKLENLWHRSNLVPISESKSFQQQKQLLQESLTELSASIEELQLACETLRQQNDELLASRQQLIRERQYYQQLFDTAPNCYLSATANGTIKEVNQKTIELLGVSPQYLQSKSLAVFIALDCRPEYYTKLNQFKRGEISEATWQLEIINRQGDKIPVECKVARMGDRESTNTDLHWQLSPIQPNIQPEKLADLTSILIENLRSPLHHLGVQVEENQKLEPAQKQTTSHRWQAVGKQVFELKNIINNGYILNSLHRKQDLNLSLIDYAIFIPHIIRQIDEQNTDLNPQPQLLMSDITSHLAGIGNVFLFKQMMINLCGNIITNIKPESIITIELTKDLTEQLIITLNLLVDQQDMQRLQQTFSSLLSNNQPELISKTDLEIAVISKCLALLQGKLALNQQDNHDVAITIKLPLVLNIN